MGLWRDVFVATYKIGDTELRRKFGIQTVY
jgi:hypothetical protein